MQRHLLVCIAVISLFAACSRKESPREQRFEVNGKVVSVEKGQKQVTLAHDEIPGYMAAMTMPFHVRDEWPLSVLAPGQRIRATLVVAGDRSWLEEIVVTEAPAIAADTATTPSPHDPAVGADVPDFTLVNQEGLRIHFRQYRGRFLLVTFIYTRCPLPDYCPRMSGYFSEIMRAVENDSGLAGNVHLLSVSFDPSFDKPHVLRDYGRAYFGERGPEAFRTWEFASGSEDEVKRITQFFGLSYWRETGQIIHSLRTGLIGPDGKLVALYRGNEWKPEDVVAGIRRLLKAR